MRRLYEHAIELGVAVRYGDPGRGRIACYIDRCRLIVLRPGMRRAQSRTALAHELGHAAHRDTATGHPAWDARQERRADHYAARLLICPSAVARAEQLHGPHLGMIARELDITPELLAVWRDHHQRASA